MSHKLFWVSNFRNHTIGRGSCWFPFGQFSLLFSIAHILNEVSASLSHSRKMDNDLKLYSWILASYELEALTPLSPSAVALRLGFCPWSILLCTGCPSRPQDNVQNSFTAVFKKIQKVEEKTGNFCTNVIRNWNQD